MRIATIWAGAALLLGLAAGVQGAPAAPAADITALRGLFQTPLQVADLDPATYAEFVDGKEIKIAPRDDKDRSALPQAIVWTQTDRTGIGRRSFGDSKTPGARHLRLGFKQPVAVGTVLVEGNVGVSVLREEQPYPGDLGDDGQWLPAERLINGQPTNAEATVATACTLWVLPPGTRTRALRLTHTAELADKVYRGGVGGIYVLGARFANLGLAAQVASRSAPEKAARLTNDSTDGFWSVWENIAPRTGDRPTAIAADPEWVMLAWPAPVTLRGLAFVFPGFEAIEVQSYAGPEGSHPRDGGESAWRSVGKAAGFRMYYPAPLGVNWIDFGKTLSTRALRIRFTATAIEARECQTHMKGNTNQGKRVWLGELLALHELGSEPLLVEAPPKPALAPTKGLIPVPFRLPEPGFVTLVIEDKDGKRVRNLISETPFPKGDNVAWWDGTDDLGRDIDAAKHGLYKIPAQLVPPGDYRVRGLWRKNVELFYEFGVYNPGTPPWSTDDHTGAWLANHTPPQAAAFLPAAKSPTGQPLVYLGAYVTEGPDGLAWMDLEGRKLGGKKWIGGTWTAAPYLAVDNGPKAVESVALYVASVWEAEKKSGVNDGFAALMTWEMVQGSGKKLWQNELRITALTKAEDKAVFRCEFPSQERDFSKQIGGLAAHNGLLAVSMTAANRVLWVDAAQGKLLGETALPAPRGLAFDAKGQLLAISGKQVVELAPQAGAQTPRIIVAEGLEEPVGLTLDAQGNLYVSDRGNSHQVKVFNSAGKRLRAIGKPGVPAAGPYDPLHMNNPHGLAIDSNRQLWVTENDHIPKRISLWTLDGQLVKAFYGPSKYGGGGVLDPCDPTRFYYADEGKGALEFQLDWEHGTSQLTHVLYRRSPADLKLPFRSAAPETVFYREVNGRKQRYFTNCYNSSPTGGHPTAFLFLEKDHVLRPVAGMGRGMDWKEVLGQDAFAKVLPADLWKNAFVSTLPDRTTTATRTHSVWKNAFFFVWSDRNGDAQVQPDEVQTVTGGSGGITVMPDLSFCVSRLGDEKTKSQTLRFAPSFDAAGIPAYDLAKPQVLAEGPQGPRSSGGDQALVDPAGNFVATLGVQPYSAYSISGGRDGAATWSYPNPWPGLHASHQAARPSFPGQVIGATRLLGGCFTPKGSDAGPLWAVNGNMGNMYVFTTDGLFVATLFEDVRRGKLWRMPVEKRGMNLAGISLHDENFWPTVSQTPDGKVYLVDGGNTCLVRVEGLESIRRLGPWSLSVDAGALKQAQDALVEAECRRQEAQGSGVLQVNLGGPAPTVDGKVDEWPNTWVDVDRSGVAANFNSDSKPYNIRAAVQVSDGKLYAAWQTADPKLLQNSGEMATAPFKTGGALDLMLGTDPQADPKRRDPVAGDLRLLVTLVKGKPLALLYRPVVPGSTTPKVSFSSPWRTLNFDRVDDVSAKIAFAADKNGNYELAIPLEVLGLTPRPGLRLAGDAGILRGDGFQTVARVYWSNKATAIVADVPSEAALVPSAWGTWEFHAP